MAQDQVTFVVGTSNGHIVGDTMCPLCYMEPLECQETPGCPGLVHENFEEEDWDNVYTSKLCDVCGESP